MKIDRNSKNRINDDIKFLNELMEKLDDNDIETARTMLGDWLKELKDLKND